MNLVEYDVFLMKQKFATEKIYRWLQRLKWTTQSFLGSIICLCFDHNYLELGDSGSLDKENNYTPLSRILCCKRCNKNIEIEIVEKE